jgi:2-oxoglutarate dehydrogenase E1 component
MKTPSDNGHQGPQNLANVRFVEDLYEQYLENPELVPTEWRGFFAEGGLTDGVVETDSPPRFTPSIPPSGLFSAPPPTTGEVVQTATALQDKVDQIIRAYRFRGHMIAELDPLGKKRPIPPDLNLEYYGLTETHMDEEFSVEGVGPKDKPRMKLRDLLQTLRNTYCRSIGVEYMHIDDLSIRRWLQTRMETTENRFTIPKETQFRILTRLTDAVMFEEFIRRKFIGAKSFSLEGAESLIPLLDLVIERSAEQGVVEIDMGMAHRGRLNVLANTLGKNPKVIFREFADMEPERYRGSGDVKYHLGHSKKVKTSSGRQVHLSLSFNPSHLEFVDPVVLGRARANSDRLGDKDYRKTLPLLIHGDAAFAGQGVVQEILNLSQLPGYRAGGALHIIVNNQIGFTTSPEDARSTMYCTDVGKMLQVPIFHVNGEDPEAVVQVVHLAMDFRATFQRDVIIDMYAYRRLGHNEADEPSFTQPMMYQAIDRQKSVRDGYLEHLLKLGEITREEADEIAEERRNHLEKALTESRAPGYRLPTDAASGVWAQYVGGLDAKVPEAATGVSAERLAELLEKVCQVPENFTVHPKLKRILDHRRSMARGEAFIDWAVAEALALASLATEGCRIRFSGQDVGRGTFSHRHATLWDYQDGTHYIPLQHLAPNQAPVDIINSPLSEVAVVGFEYGYSLECPDGLVLWEAQFGDFCNVAQVVIDQFITSAEDKWRRLSGVVLLLPHGYEGQGPEHSSARLERFLNLCAEDNIQVVQPTTPAQYFHMLRRQVLRPIRKPLVVMTPKSLLRHPRVVSTIDDLASGTWQAILPDSTVKPDQVRHVLICTGKIYYELLARREELKDEATAILRMEQLYPVGSDRLQQALASFPAGTPVTWVQEEPENMGAWRHFRIRFGDDLIRQRPLAYVSRPESSSPATGSANSHKNEQEQVLTSAFQIPESSNNNPIPFHVHRIESSQRR